MTILIADSANLIAGSLITEVVSPDGKYVARFADHVEAWVIEPDTLVNALAIYPHVPGMNALVALRRFLAERERDSIGQCHSCGQMMYRDDDIVTEWLPAAGEPAAVMWIAHRRCTEPEGED